MKRLDDTTLEKLWQDHADALYRFFLARTGRPADAEDLVGEIFLRAVQEPRLAEEDFAARAWLFRVGINLSNNLFRRVLGRLVSGLENLLEPVAREDTEADAVRREDFLRLSAGLRSISAADRDLVWLRWFEEMSYGEIARITGVAEGTVASRIHRALGRLRHAMGE